MNRVGIIVLGDFIAFWSSFILILFVRFGASSYQSAISTHIVPFAILYLSWVLSFYLFGLYDLFTIKPTIAHLNRFGMALFTSFVIGIFLFYFVSFFGISPKTNLFFQVIGFGLISFIIRRIVYILFSIKITRPIILIGRSACMDTIQDVILNNPQLGLQVISRSDDFQKTLNEYNSLKNIIFVFDKIPEEISNESILNLYKNKTEVIDIVQAYETYLQKIPVNRIDKAWIVKNINIKENIINTITKRIFDIIFAIALLIATIPILLVCFLFIYINDHGPIFYKQKRVGLNGKIFVIYKLRSMIVDSEKGIATCSSGHNDARVTPVGKIMRRLHIDEIPQMINILKGDMSLIGPRPERPEFVEPYEQAIPHYEIRHIIRPGFTGWAQIKYRYSNSVESTKEKFEYDLYYIKNKNIFIDFAVFVKTIQIIFTH